MRRFTALVRRLLTRLTRKKQDDPVDVMFFVQLEPGELVPANVYFLRLAYTLKAHPFLKNHLTHEGRRQVNRALAAAGEEPMFDLKTPAALVEELLEEVFR